MPHYICVTHALSRREETDTFCRGLSRYGFRFVCIHEQSEPLHREETLSEASLLIALTCPAAAAAETVASDIRRALERRMPVLCVSMGENELDDRFCTASEGGAVLIPAPAGDTPDRQTVALFIHRLFIRHLARLSECFSAVRCVEDTYGRTIVSAVAAHKGDARACYALGLAYEQGKGVPKLEVEAARWISRAADQGIMNARIRMGELYLSGRGTERNPEAAFRLFTEAAMEGDPRGNYRRGLCYLRGWGVMKDPERAYDCLQDAAHEGYAPALYELGLMHRDGVGCAHDHRRAVSLVYRACLRGAEGEEQVLPLSLSRCFGKGKPTCITMRRLRRTRLRLALLDGQTKKGRILREYSADALVSRSFARSRITGVDLPEDGWIHEPAETAEGHETDAVVASVTDFSIAGAAVTLGRLLAEGDEAVGIHPHPSRALVWYRYAIRMGDVSALYQLGDAYRRGYGIPTDGDRAFRLYRMAADLGDERGRFALGVCYEKGIGTEPDPHKAFLCYEQAALAGYAPAQNNLGGCYEHGLGVVRDITAAAEWYARATAAKLPEAACRLGLCYEYGRGVERNMVKALRLYETAVEGGNPYAKYRLALCCYRGIQVREDAVLTAPGEREETTAQDVSVRHVKEAAATLASDYVRAARLLEGAVEEGVADAAYMLSLYYATGRGVRRDENRSLALLQKAADGGYLPACYGLGIYCLEGRFLVRNHTRAVEHFAEVAALWANGVDSARCDDHPEGILARQGLTPAEAAGSALYMLGYCTLYGIGDRGNPKIASLEREPASDERVRIAADYFEEAARADHVGALTALGDLYAYGLLKPLAASAEDESFRYYMEAARVGTSREFVSDISTDSPIDALMSLAKLSTQVAEHAAAEGDEGSAELARVQTWRSLAGCSEQGSLDAYVSMAACAYHGYGTPKNPAAALWFLEKAAQAEGGRVTASLWLGDVYYAGMDRDPAPEQANAAYLRAVSLSDTESECGEYTVRERREDRRQVDRAARAEAFYRLAVLRAVYFAEGETVLESFPYLVKAVLMGHAAARRDLARMYAFESAYIDATSPKEKKARRKRVGPAGAYARHRLDQRAPDSATRRDGRAGRSHEGWMTDYYTALWPVPVPFSSEMKAMSAPTDRPDYVSAEVTPAMLAAALNYLGDCLFFGNRLPADPAAAVACYREVVDMPIQVPRGQDPFSGLVWAQYSYGWCLLYGIGTPEDPRRAVFYLSLAAKTHAEACYVLGECYEKGVGVDVPDGVEAFKYYRKALKLGYRKAELKVLKLEKQLRAEA